MSRVGEAGEKQEKRTALSFDLAPHRHTHTFLCALQHVVCICRALLSTRIESSEASSPPRGGSSASDRPLKCRKALLPPLCVGLVVARRGGLSRLCALRLINRRNPVHTRMHRFVSFRAGKECPTYGLRGRGFRRVMEPVGEAVVKLR